MEYIGRLKVQCFNGDSYVPVDDCKVSVESDTNEMSVRAMDLSTDSSGLTETVDLNAPPLEYSQKPSDNLPYSRYNLRVQKNGFDDVVIRGVQVFPEQTAFQKVNLQETGTRSSRADVIVVLPNRLNGDYPAKIPENPQKPLPPPSSGVVLQMPVVPEYITVHQGGPNDPSAPNYRVMYKDYLKNVASCEIYSTWSESTIRANLYCIISFTLNRIYTEWYRGKGKNFDITSSTAYDHAFNYGRNVYDNISEIVDEIFSTYVKRVGRKQPLLTQYCDGKNVQCPQWLSQWGSKYLGDQGKVPYEILTNYYGNDIELTTAEKVTGSPVSYEGELKIGSTGEAVKMAQTFLNRIAQNYPLIPKVAVDGVYGPATQEAVKVFQGIFGLPKTGVIDYATWYKISDVYVGVSKIAELRCDNIFYPPMSNLGFRGAGHNPSFAYPL